jgi:predicted ATPase
MRAYILTGTPGSASHALGQREPWRDNRFIDQVVTLQRQHQDAVRTRGNVFFDRCARWR